MSYNKPKSKDPGIGVGVFLANVTEDKILIGVRKDSQLLGLPGGWLEKGEEWEDCAARELKEETGLVKPPQSFRHIYTLNCKPSDRSFHNISCVMYNEVEPDEVSKIKNMEPEKCYGWFWVSFGELRQKIDRLFHPLRDFLNKFPDMNTVSYLKKMIKPYGNVGNI